PLPAVPRSPRWRRALPAGRLSYGIVSAFSPRSLDMRGARPGGYPPGRARRRALEVDFEAEPDPPGGAREAGQPAEDVVQRVGGANLLGLGEETVAVAVALLRPDHVDAVGRRGAAVIPHPGPAPAGGRATEGEVDGAVGGEDAVPAGLVGEGFDLVRPDPVPFLVVLDVVRLGEDRVDVPEVEQVPDLGVRLQVQAAEAEALGDPEVELAQAGEPGAVVVAVETAAADAAGKHV